MPVLDNKVLATFHEPIGQMSDAELLDYISALEPYRKIYPVTVERKIRDIHSELEWRGAAHSEKAP